MGLEETYLGRLGNSSIFSRSSFNRTIGEGKGPFADENDGAYKVVIKPEGSRTLSPKDEGYYVKGVLKGNISLTNTANWGALELDSYLGGLISNLPGLRQAKALAKGVMTVKGIHAESELQDKKFYTGGDYLSFPINMRVFDDTNVGKPIEAYIFLLGMSMPREYASVTLADTIEVIRGTFSDLGKTILEKGFTKEAYVQAQEDIKHGTKKIDEHIQSNRMKAESNSTPTETNTLGLGSDVIRLTQSPTTVTVQIGNWLELESMVIDSLNVDFSYQQTEAGPQYADFTINVSSRYRMVLTKTGIKRMKIGTKKGRVRFLEAGQKSGKLGVFA